MTRPKKTKKTAINHSSTWIPQIISSIITRVNKSANVNFQFAKVTVTRGAYAEVCFKGNLESINNILRHATARRDRSGRTCVTFDTSDEEGLTLAKRQCQICKDQRRLFYLDCFF